MGLGVQIIPRGKTLGWLPDLKQWWTTEHKEKIKTEREKVLKERSESSFEWHTGFIWRKHPAGSWNCKSELQERPRLETYVLKWDHLQLGVISQGKSMERGEVRPKDAFTCKEHITRIPSKKTKKGWTEKKPREEGISESIRVQQSGLEQYSLSWGEGVSGSSLSWETCREFNCVTTSTWILWSISIWLVLVVLTSHLFLYFLGGFATSPGEDPRQTGWKHPRTLGNE